MKNAIIIGSGPAGLTAAYQLLKNTDIKPIIIEEQNCVGGIAKTIKFGDNYLDVGPHHFYTKSDDIKKIWDEILPEQGSPSKDDILINREIQININGPDPEIEDNVMLIRKRFSRILYDNKFFSYPLSFSFATMKKLGILKSFYFGIGLIFARIKKKDETSLENYLINNFGYTLYKEFFRDYTFKAWGVDPKTVSKDCGTQRINGLSIRKIIIKLLKSILKIDTKKDEEEGSINEVTVFKYPKYGAGQMWSLMSEKIQELGGTILLSTKLININIENNIVKEVTIKSDNIEQKLKTDYVISTMPIKNLFESFNTDLDINKNLLQSAINLPYRDFVLVAVCVNKLKLINDTDIKTINGIIPDCWTYIYNGKVKVNRINVFNNFSPYVVNKWDEEIMVGLEYICSEKDEIWTLDEESATSFAIKEAELLGLFNSKDVVSKTRIKEKKAYPAYFGSYNNFSDIKNYIDSINNLYSIGRNGQHNYIDMDQAMLSAIKCVNNICSDDKNKSGVWDLL